MEAAEENTDEDADEALCRFCFGGCEDGELVSPCSCTGGQKYVHLSCLRRWQRMVLVSQPTHPAFWQDDVRHHKCNVCLADFSCAPPSRHELMESFTGPELAALLEEGCLIGAHGAFSEELEGRLPQVPAMARDLTNYEHWIRGVYLITDVQEDSPATLTLTLSNKTELDAFREHLRGGLSMALRGQRFRVKAAGSLREAADGSLQEALASLSAPADLVLEAEAGADCGEDHISAVNLARPLDRPPRPAHVARILAKARRDQAGCGEGVVPDVEVVHYHGGPCDDHEIACCIVLGGSTRGWTLVKCLQAALELALQRAARRCEAQGDVVEGQTVELRPSAPAPGRAGQRGVALRFLESSGQWLVRLPGGEALHARPEDLEPREGCRGRVLAFWGDAQWSRAQLLGEIARGHWGLCRAALSDLLAPARERWRALDGRLAFAPVTEMTEDFLREASREMASLLANARQASQPEGAEGAEEAGAGEARQDAAPALVTSTRP